MQNVSSLPLLFYFLGFALSSPILGQDLNPEAIEIMSYNVEHLYEKKSSLPKGRRANCKKKTAAKSHPQPPPHIDYDCSKHDHSSKVCHIAKVIKSRPYKPQILALQEIDSPEILEALLSQVGIDTFEITSNIEDPKTNVALAYVSDPRLEFRSAKSHTFQWEGRNLRDILEVRFQLNTGKALAIFVNHWPSQYSPTEKRRFAASMIQNLIKQNLKEGILHNIVLGDFNTLSTEQEPHPFGILSQTNLVDAQSLMPHDIPILPGTYFYHPDYRWSYLDRIFVSSSFLSKSNRWFVQEDGYEIHAPEFATMIVGEDFEQDEENIFLERVPKPFYFDPSRKEHGYSDHFPVIIKLRQRL